MIWIGMMLWLGELYCRHWNLGSIESLVDTYWNMDHARFCTTQYQDQ